MEYEENMERDKKSTNVWSKFKNIFGKTKENEIPMDNDKSMWVPDEKAQTCYHCQKQFSAIFLRKHHCRICGNVFCKECSNQTVDGKYWGSKKEIKVCEYCFEMYKKLDETLIETTIENPHNYIEDIESIDDNIKNLKRETKLSEYCKKTKKDSEECSVFLKMEKKYEEGIKQNLENCYEALTRLVIESFLKKENLNEKWQEKINELVRKTISQVNPSFRDLNDTLNINEYVKIKTIVYKDHSLCKVIDGFAFQKNVCSKKMNTNIDNPKILLLDCALDYTRSADKITNYQNLLQEPAYYDIILKKIDLVEPNVILVNKNVSRNILEKLSASNKFSLVINVKSSSLKKIARCTKTYVLPSTDLIDKRTILGTCRKFRIEKIKTNIQNQSLKNDLLKANEFNLMIFEGCDYLLHNTIILSGPDEEELKRLKNIMKKIILVIRDIFLQKSLIYFFFCDFFNDNLASDASFSRQSVNSSSKTSTVSLLSNQALSQMTIKTSNQTIINSTGNNILFKNGLNSNLHIRENEDPLLNREFFNAFDIILMKNRMLKVVKLTLTQGTTQQSVLFDKFYQPIDKNNMNQITGQIYVPQGNQDFVESDILKIVNSICEEPEDLTLIYYAEDEFYDKPLGKLIIDLCNEGETKCESCKKLKSSHIYYIYKNFGRIKIEMIQNIGDNTDYIENIMELINRETTDFSKYNNNFKGDREKLTNKKGNNYNLDIYSYGVCKICQKVVTPLIKHPKEIFNFSVAKFFRFMLTDHFIKNRNDRRDFNLTKALIATNDCEHYVNKDINRIFITKLGTIKFSYENSPIYVIESSPVHEISNPKYYLNVLDIFLKEAKHNSFEVLDMLERNFIFYTDHLAFLSQYIHDNSNYLSGIPNFTLYIEKISKCIAKYLLIIKEIHNFASLFFSSSNRFSDYVKAIVYIKKVYFRIVQVKIVLNNIRKILKKFRSAINLIIKTKNSTPKTEQSDKESLRLTVNMASNSNIAITNLLPVDIEFNNIAYSNVEENFTYKKIVKEVSFIDENHSKYSSDNSIEDLSSIIAYTLTSDNYREYISPYNRFRLIDIKCDRKAKGNFDYMQFFKDRINHEAKMDRLENQNSNLNKVNEFNGTKENPNQNNSSSATLNNSDKTYGFNFITTHDDDVYETFLLFDQSKNIYSYPNLDNHKIYQQLETELLSDEKTHFSMITNNSNIMNILCTTNMPIEYCKSKRNETSNNLNIHKNKSESTINTTETSNESKVNITDPFNDDKIILQGDNIKVTIDEMESMKKEIRNVKESWIQFNDYKTKTKHKKFEFIEDSTFSTLEYEVIVYFPRQFEALRITYCATYDDFILSVFYNYL